jgi:hypothetical protein
MLRMSKSVFEGMWDAGLMLAEIMEIFVQCMSVRCVPRRSPISFPELENISSGMEIDSLVGLEMILPLLGR